MNIFEKGTRLNLTFKSTSGTLSIQDLWHLPLTSKTGKANLDDVARTISADLKNSGEVSFVLEKTEESEIDALKLDIVKHIIKVRIDENKSKLEAKEKEQRKQKILDAINAKKDEALNDMSVEELQKELETL